MCLSKERSVRHDEHPAARPIPPTSKSQQPAMPRDAPEMRRVPATTPPANAIPLPASRNTHAAATNTDAAAAKIPAQPARPKQVIVNQQHDVGARGYAGAGAGDAGTPASGQPRRQRGSIYAPTMVPHPLTEAPLNTSNTSSGPRGRQPSMAASGAEKWAAMAAAAVEDDVDFNSLRLTLSRSGSVSAYATSPRMSVSSVGGVATRTKTRERIVYVDQSGNRREYFR